MLALFTDTAANCAEVARSTAGREQILRDPGSGKLRGLSHQGAAPADSQPIK